MDEDSSADTTAESYKNLERTVEEMKKVLDLVVNSIDNINVSIVEMKSTLKDAPKEIDSDPPNNVITNILETTFGNNYFQTLTRWLQNFYRQSGLPTVDQKYLTLLTVPAVYWLLKNIFVIFQIIWILIVFKVLWESYR